MPYLCSVITRLEHRNCFCTFLFAQTTLRYEEFQTRLQRSGTEMSRSVFFQFLASRNNKREVKSTKIRNFAKFGPKDLADSGIQAIFAALKRIERHFPYGILERCRSGRSDRTRNAASGSHCFQGSNPCLSAGNLVCRELCGTFLFRRLSFYPEHRYHTSGIR